MPILPRFLRVLALLLGCVLAVHATAAASFALPQSNANLPSAMAQIAVIYADDDADESADLARIVAGIKGAASDVVIYRLHLAANEVATNAVAGDLLSRPGSFKLAQAGKPGNIAVIYPDLGEPYRGIFNKIIEGIEEQIKTRVASIAVGSAVNSEDVTASLKRQGVKVVIALGRQGLKAASALDSGFGVIVGGVISVPEGEASNYRVNSLAPDPALLFERLKRMMPSARRVFVVHDPRQTGWLVRIARENARTQGLELVVTEAQDLKLAVHTYQEILPTMDARKDVLWLPQDSTTAEETAVLPLVLEEAWSRNLTVFSSNVAHVRRGVLFSLYPNNAALGRQLAASAQSFSVSGTTTPGLVPLRDVLVAVNIRTAKHLGLQLPNPLQGIDMVFPEQ